MLAVYTAETSVCLLGSLQIYVAATLGWRLVCINVGTYFVLAQTCLNILYSNARCFYRELHTSRQLLKLCLQECFSPARPHQARCCTNVYMCFRSHTVMLQLL